MTVTFSPSATGNERFTSSEAAAEAGKGWAVVLRTTLAASIRAKKMAPAESTPGVPSPPVVLSSDIAIVVSAPSLSALAASVSILPRSAAEKRATELANASEDTPVSVPVSNRLLPRDTELGVETVKSFVFTSTTSKLKFITTSRPTVGAPDPTVTVPVVLSTETMSRICVVSLPTPAPLNTVTELPGILSATAE